MKFDRILLAAGAIAAAIAGGPANVQTANAQNWTGVYIGANGGYAWGDTTASFTPNDVTSQNSGRL
jgi:outer membrane immunogenic protein